MRLKTFTASDMQSAMRMIREALGESAIIISSSRAGNGRQITVTAAVERSDDFQPIALHEVTAPQPMPEWHSEERVLGSLREVLTFHNVPSALAEKWLRSLSHQGYEVPFSGMALRAAKPVDETSMYLEKLLENGFAFHPLPLEMQGIRLMVVGPPGVGKTLAVAKMAAQLSMQRESLDDPATVVITTDNKRAGGVEQLSAFTDILGIPLHVANTRGDLWKVLQGCTPRDRVLIDTGGCNPYTPSEIEEIDEFLTLGGIEPVLAAAAGGDAEEAADITRAFLPLKPKRLLLTRVDTARRLGGTLAAAYAGGLAFCNASGASSIVGEFRSVDAPALARMLLQYQLQSAPGIALNNRQPIKAYS